MGTKGQGTRGLGGTGNGEYRIVINFDVIVEFFSIHYIFNSMNVEDQISLAVAYRKTNVSALARAMKMTRQNLHRKIENNTLRKEDLCKIGKILDAKYVSYFYFDDGTIIGDSIKKN
jgi:hypothetical protein